MNAFWGGFEKRAEEEDSKTSKKEIAKGMASILVPGAVGGVIGHKAGVHLGTRNQWVDFGHGGKLLGGNAVKRGQKFGRRGAMLGATLGAGAGLAYLVKKHPKPPAHEPEEAK